MAGTPNAAAAMCRALMLTLFEADDCGGNAGRLL